LVSFPHFTAKKVIPRADFEPKTSKDQGICRYTSGAIVAKPRAGGLVDMHSSASRIAAAAIVPGNTAGQPWGLAKEAFVKRLLSRSVLVSATLFAILVPTRLHATATEVRILQGSLVQSQDLTGHLDIEGTSGLRMDAALIARYASIDWGFCDLHPCLPGDSISLRSGYGVSFNPLTGSGQVTLSGQTYDLFTDAPAYFEFDAGIILPELTDGPVQLSTPFTFSGTVEVPNKHDESGGSDVFQLSGSGVATATLVRSIYTESWIVASVTYDFTPRASVP
jgi:hypothetical protein